MRTAAINRVTAETSISLKLELDGSGASTVDSGCGFLDHMLTLFADILRGFDLTLNAGPWEMEKLSEAVAEFSERWFAK